MTLNREIIKSYAKVLLFYTSVFVMAMSGRRNDDTNTKRRIRYTPLLATIIISLFLSDMFSGCVHIVFDNYNGTNRYLKPVALQFQTHHDDPKDLLNVPFVKILGDTSAFFPIPLIMGIGNIVVRRLWRWPISSHVLQYIVIGEVVFCVTAHVSQLSHYASHAMTHASVHENEQISYKIIGTLQQYGVLLDPGVHRVHHRKLDCNYAILTGWSNFLLNGMYKHFTPTVSAVDAVVPE